VERRCGDVVVEVDHSGSTTLSASFAAPAYLSNAAGFLDQIARLGVSGDKVDETHSIFICPNISRLANECVSLRNDNRPEPL
jgi:hypothetical protein